ncbi:MAG: DUF2802 domain-containing protein [Gammaproteobacteria bacterium]|nr:DUF2802 domain-containing protein [Gammaproteobacteria bacterium]
MSNILIATTGMAVLLATGLVVQFVLIFSQRRELRKQQRLIGLLQADIGALCAGAVGADQRVAQLEKQGRSADSRQQIGESRQPPGQPYGKAIQLVHEGASPAELVEQLGLSRSEAELVVMLHGGSRVI